MTEPKRKPQSGLREPKPKKTLGLKVPAPLRMPHEELFHLAERPAEEPAPNAYQSEPDTSITVKPVSQSNRFTQDTEAINKPVAQANRFTRDTSVTIEPEQQVEERPIDTSSPITPVPDEPVSKAAPVAESNRFTITTGSFQTPVLQTAQYQEPKTHYFKVPNEVADQVLAMLDDDEFKVYFRLFRLSHGHKRTACFVGYSTLAKACKMSLSKIKRVMPRLLARELIRVVEVHNGPDKKGTEYEVFTSPFSEPVSQVDRFGAATGVTGDPNKHDDHDDSIKESHHQSEVMRIYADLTGKLWTKADTAHYERVKDIPVEKIELLMRLIHNRAGEPIGSFAFFATSILNELSPSGQQSRAALKKKYEQFAREIAGANVGGNLAPSERIYQLKSHCLRAGVAWNDDLANEVLGI